MVIEARLHGVICAGEAKVEDRKWWTRSLRSIPCGKRDEQEEEEEEEEEEEDIKNKWRRRRSRRSRSRRRCFGSWSWRRSRTGKMEWFSKILFPVRRVWLGLAARMRTRRRGRGLLKLYNDVQSCGYQDVQIMWEMIQQNSESCASPRRRRSSWRFCFWTAP